MAPKLGPIDVVVLVDVLVLVLVLVLVDVDVDVGMDDVVVDEPGTVVVVVVVPGTLVVVPCLSKLAQAHETVFTPCGSTGRLIPEGLVGKIADLPDPGASERPHESGNTANTQTKEFGNAVVARGTLR